MLISSSPGSLKYPGLVYPASCGARQTAASTVTVAGVAGTRVDTRYTGAWHCIGLPPQHIVEYTFSAHQRTYDLSYAFRQGDPDDLSADFDTLVGSVTFAS